jgi:peptidoglycan/LPS O-acetylase OafA/YrhL
MSAKPLTAQPALDWLRFVLAALVLLGHENIFEFPPLDPGHAVDAFLALSGWLIGTILLSTRVEELPRFFYNRVTRVWLPYFVTITLLYGLAAAREGIDGFWFKYLFYDLSFTHYTFTHFPQAAAELPLDGTGNGLWSISVEEQFYLFLPLGLILGQKIGARWPWFAAILILMTLAERFGAWHLTLPGRALVYAALAASGLAIALGVPPNPWIDAVFGVTVVLALAFPGERSAWGQFFGGISYPLYLNAWIGVFAANLLAKKLGLSEAVREGLICLLAFLTATVSWYLIDRNILARRGGGTAPPSVALSCRSVMR